MEFELSGKKKFLFLHQGVFCYFLHMDKMEFHVLERQSAPDKV